MFNGKIAVSLLALMLYYDVDLHVLSCHVLQDGNGDKDDEGHNSPNNLVQISQAVVPHEDRPIDPVD